MTFNLKTKKKLNIDNRINLFLESHIAENNIQLNTTVAYQSDLIQFQNFMGDTAIWKASVNIIENFLLEVSKVGASKATIRRKLSAIKQYLAFAKSENWIDTNPALKVSGPKKELKLPKVLSETDIERLISASYEYGKSVEPNSRHDSGRERGA